MTRPAKRIAVWCVGGEDSELRIPFYVKLGSLGFDVTAVGSGPAAPFKRQQIRYIEYELDRFFSPRSNVRSLMELIGLLRAHRPAIIHGFDTKPSLLAPIAAAQARVGRAIRTINGLGWVFSSSSLPAMALRLPYLGLQASVRAMTAMTVFQNAHDQQLFETLKLVSPERSRLILGSGIDVAQHCARVPDSDRLEALRRELGLGNKKVVTTVSRMTRQKGISTLLKAAARVSARHSDVVFLLVGPLEEEGPLATPRRTVEQHAPYVRAIGRRSDVPALLALTSR